MICLSPGYKEVTKELGTCLNVLECTSQCDAIATKSNLLAILTTDHVEVYNKYSFELIHTIGLGDACSSVNSIAFGDGESILVSD